MKIARGSKDERKNRAVMGIMINGVFIHSGMEIEITGYDQEHMNNKELVTVRGIVMNVNDCALWIQHRDKANYVNNYYIHSHGVKKIVYDFEEEE